jgi:hypothetical protein
MDEASPKRLRRLFVFFRINELTSLTRPLPLVSDPGSSCLLAAIPPSSLIDSSLVGQPLSGLLKSTVWARKTTPTRLEATCLMLWEQV